MEYLSLSVFRLFWGQSVHLSQSGLYSKTSGHRVKRGAIWDSGIVVKRFGDTMDLLLFKVILGIGALS